MKTKLVKRNKLFYDKYKYKVDINLMGSRYLKRSLTYIDFIRRVTDMGYPNKDYATTYCDLFYFYKKYNNTKKVTFLHSWDFLGMYTSDETIINELLALNLGLKIQEAVIPPEKTMYFANEPQFKYRMYLKSKKVSDTLMDSLSGIVDRYTDSSTIHFSDGLTKFINSKHWKHRTYSYLNNSHFIEFNEDTMITILHLVVGECLGKTYKLEKRPE